MHKRAIWLIIAVIAVFGFVAGMKYWDGGTSWLWDISQRGKWLLPLVGVAALIDSINPCAFSILILTIIFLLSIGKLREKVLLIGGSYIFGIFVVYVLIGLGILQVLHLFNTPNFMGRVGAGILIAWGLLNIVNEFFPKFPIKLQIPRAVHHSMAVMMEKASVPVAFGLGAFVGLCEFPCTGGPYLMVLGLLHDQATYFRGLGYLALYNLIFVLPLVLILFLASDPKFADKIQVWQKSEVHNMRLWGGFAMVALGLLLFAFII